MPKEAGNERGSARSDRAFSDFTTDIPAGMEPPVETEGLGATIWNDSGGVGKTTFTVNTAESLSVAGYNTLVIDLDPQTGCLTEHLGIGSMREKSKFAHQVINDPAKIKNNIIQGERIGKPFDMIPASPDLGDFGQMVATYEGNVLFLLAQALRRSGLADHYDVTLIDAAGNRGPLVKTAITATSSVIIPVEASPKGVSSLDGFVEYADEIEGLLRRDGIDLSINVDAIVPSMVKGQRSNPRTYALKEFYRMYLRDEFPVTPFFMWNRSVLEDAWLNSQTIRDYLQEKRLNDRIRDIPNRFDHIARVAVGGHHDYAADRYNDYEVYLNDAEIQSVKDEFAGEADEADTPDSAADEVAQ